MQFKKVHISQIFSGDTILHNGKIKTVCKNNIKYDSFMGISIFGDTYHSGNKLVTKIILNNKKISMETVDFSNFDVELLDVYETMIFKDLVTKSGCTTNEALNIIVNNTEGDYTQLSQFLFEFISEFITEV